MAYCLRKNPVSHLRLDKAISRPRVNTFYSIIHGPGEHRLSSWHMPKPTENRHQMRRDALLCPWDLLHDLRGHMTSLSCTLTQNPYQLVWGQRKNVPVLFNKSNYLKYLGNNFNTILCKFSVDKLIIARNSMSSIFWLELQVQLPKCDFMLLEVSSCQIGPCVRERLYIDSSWSSVCPDCTSWRYQ